MTKVMESVDLIILGAGYAGINAFNAACHHLQPGSHVVVIAREESWGGQWTWQYDYVRLHQPYRSFTCGEREWTLDRPWEYQATKKEILRHFEYVAAACVEEKQIQLVELFGYEAAEHHTIDGNTVELNAKPIQDSRLPSFKIRAKLLIKAVGFEIPHKFPLSFSSSNKIHSLIPKDVLTPKWNVEMQFGEDAGKPIYVIGSGKTAMEVMYVLLHKFPDAAKRLRCVSGRGTWFINRDKINPPKSFLARNAYGSKLVADYQLELLEGFDGTNAAEHLSEISKGGVVHSPFPNPSSFAAGLCSEYEVELVRNALSPPEERIIQGHLLDIVDVEDGLALEMRSLGGNRFLHPIEPGSFIVNCTDHLRPQKWEPILSDDGMVLSPQNATGFTGPSANLIVHLFYTNRNALELIWKELPRISIDMKNDKARFGLDVMMTVLSNTEMLKRALPKDALKYSPIRGSIPLHRAIVMARRLMGRFKELIKGSTKIIKGRFTDECPPEIIEDTIGRHGHVGQQIAGSPPEIIEDTIGRHGHVGQQIAGIPSRL